MRRSWLKERSAQVIRSRCLTNAVDSYRVMVEVEAGFGAERTAAEHLANRGQLSAKAPVDPMIDVMRHTDSVAEVQSKVRRSCAVALTDIEASEAV